MADPGVDPALVPAAFACGHCGARLRFAGVRTEICPYCASPNFVERPAARDQPRPELVVAFTGDASAARRHLGRWLGRRRWLTDARIRRARIEDLRGIYLPAYLYSAVAHTRYTASIGEQYTETQRVEIREPGGQNETATRSVTRTEYRALAGRHVGYVTDVLISASAAVGQDELRRIGPFDLRTLRRYSPALISGWIAEESARDPEVCRLSSRAEAVEDIGLRLRRFMPGDSHCDLAWQTQVSWESLDPILVPVWVLAVRYRDDRPVLRVVINGQTGAVAGKAPLSGWKVALAVLVAAGALAAVVVLALLHGGAPR